MTLESVLLLALSFCVGWLGGSGIYVWKFGKDVAVLINNHKNMKEEITELKKDMKVEYKELTEMISKIRVDTPPCQFHIDLKNDFMEFKGKVDAHLESH